MAIYRQIHIDFWQDELVTELSSEEKYFFIYLMTNSKTTQCGVYRVNLKIMAFDLGWDKSNVEKLLTRFVEKERILFNPEHNEIFILNWLKYNNARSPKVATLVKKQIQEIKTPFFQKRVIEQCIQYGYPIGTISQPEPEPTPEPEPSQHSSLDDDILKINKIVTSLQDKGIHAANNPDFLSGISKIYLEVGHDLTEHLAKIIVQMKPNNPLKYAIKISGEWKNNNIDTVEKAIAESEARKKKQSPSKDEDFDKLRQMFGG